MPGKDTNEMVHLIDSSTIDLNLNQLEWAQFRSTKAGIKLHTVYDPHVLVAKLKIDANLRDIDYQHPRGLKQSMMASLLQGD